MSEMGGGDMVRNQPGKRRSNRGSRRSLAMSATTVVVLVSLLPIAPAMANYGSEHIRFPDQAYQILNVMRRGAFYAEKARRLSPDPSAVFPPLTTAPAGADPATW